MVSHPPSLERSPILREPPLKSAQTPLFQRPCRSRTRSYFCRRKLFTRLLPSEASRRILPCRKSSLHCLRGQTQTVFRSRVPCRSSLHSDCTSQSILACGKARRKAGITPEAMTTSPMALKRIMSMDSGFTLEPKVPSSQLEGAFSGQKIFYRHFNSQRQGCNWLAKIKKDVDPQHSTYKPSAKVLPRPPT